LGKTIELSCTDGEVVQAYVISVSEQDKDVVYDLVSSNMAERYQNRQGNEAYLTPFEEIESIRVLAD
jgi:hypothetical protein